MHQGPGFVPRSSASARWSSGGGVHRGGSNPSAGTERSYDWSYRRSLLMPPSRLRLSPCPCRETSIFNAGKAMWARGYAYFSTLRPKFCAGADVSIAAPITQSALGQSPPPVRRFLRDLRGLCVSQNGPSTRAVVWVWPRFVSHKAHEDHEGCVLASRAAHHAGINVARHDPGKSRPVGRYRAMIGLRGSVAGE